MAGHTARILHMPIRASIYVGLLALTTLSSSASAETKPFSAVIVEIDSVDRGRVASWKKEGFHAVVLVLDDRHSPRAIQDAAEAIATNSLDFYYWIEVGRDPGLAHERPELMASLGMHSDWRKRFPSVRPTQKNEVVKAWPWAPICYREAFAAHRARVERLLACAPTGYRGVLLNDLQAGPASCGCGNLQCRWAVDYGVPSTATKLTGPDIAARFVAEVQKSLKDKEVIPVWTTECEQEDLPPGHRSGTGWSTGYCGGVACYTTCTKRFNEQWSALTLNRRGPVGLLLLHREFERDRKEYGGPTHWIPRAFASVEKQAGGRLPREQLWLVVQGYGVTQGEETAARKAASKTGAAGILVARTRIDQSYEPRIVAVKSKQPLPSHPDANGHPGGGSVSTFSKASRTPNRSAH
jgi:hypothetical protein